MMSAYQVFCWSSSEEALVTIALAGDASNLLDELVEAGIHAARLGDGPTQPPPAPLRLAEID